MNYKELKLIADNEVDWLIYYANRDTRKNITIESDLYEELKSIGYAKRRSPLYARCARGILSASTQIIKETKLEDIDFCWLQRDTSKNRYTPLEVYLILFPEEKQEIINKLKDNL